MTREEAIEKFLTANTKSVVEVERLMLWNPTLTIEENKELCKIGGGMQNAYGFARRYHLGYARKRTLKITV